jgi:phosphate transport system substrate-binding protein
MGLPMKSLIVKSMRGNFTVLIALLLILLAVGSGVVWVLMQEANIEAHDAEDEYAMGEFEQTIPLAWTGCGISKKAYMMEMARAYEESKGISITVSGGGATKGIRATHMGTTDIGGSCRLYLKGIGDTVHERESGVEFVHVAWDALVAIAHPNNPVDNMSLRDLKKVYDGKIANWKALGGPDRRVILVVRDGKYSGVGHMFRKLIFHDQEYVFKGKIMQKVKSTGPLEKKVSRSVFAFGVDGISSAKKANVKI